MLLSQGMQQPQGQMVGRFYVPPSPLQHVGNLAQAGVGAYLMHANDQKRMEMAKAIQDRQKKEVAEFQQSLAPKPVEQPVEGPGAPIAGPTGDMEGPAPTMTTMQPRSKEEVQQAITQAMMGQNPRVREAAKFMAERQAAEQEKESQRAFMGEQRGMDRDLKREGIEANSAMRLEQMKNTAALTAMQIDSRERAGQDATDLKRALAEQSAEIKKLEIASREKMATAHDETLKAIAGMKGSGKEDKAQEAKQAGYQQVQELTAQLKTYHDDLRAGGGETDSEKGALSNLGASLSGSTPGQIIGKTFGTKNQDARNKIAMTRPVLMASIMKATGMSAKQLDSNVELKLWLSTATDPDLGYQANMEALKNIQNFVEAGLGKGSSPAPATPVPSGKTGTVRKYNPATGKIE
jgi:hypothetical protein